MVQQGEMTRFGEQEQEILGYLHQWTNGDFWNRLVILDRASFNYDSLLERSGKDKSYWFKSQTTDVEAIRNLILNVGKQTNKNGQQKWTIRRNGKDTPLKPSDLQGIKRVPFDAKQTIFCDKIRPGCTPVNSRKCRNLKFSKACHKMPIWENEAPIEDREFDNKQNDDDFYHENEYEEVLFWEDVATNRESKYFFYEQLKILTKHIKEATPKIQTNREVFKREVLEWNDSYDEQFISKTTDIKQCTIPKVEQLQQLNHGGECNRWGTWFEDTQCPYVVPAQDKKNEIVTIPLRNLESFPLICVNCMARFNTRKIKHVRINAVGVVGIEQIASVKVSAIVSGGENVCASMVGQQKSIRTYAREHLEAVIEK